MHLVFWTGDHPNRSPAIHFVLHPDGIGYGAGQWALSSDDVEKYRRAVTNKGARGKLLNILDLAKSIGCDLPPATLVRIPKGFEADKDWEDLLKRKSIVVRTSSDIAIPKILMTSDAPDYITGIFEKLAPLNGWINNALK